MDGTFSVRAEEGSHWAQGARGWEDGAPSPAESRRIDLYNKSHRMGFLSSSLSNVQTHFIWPT